MSKIENPLVSIIVITYNSSKYVLETLESAKAQTYNNIELIISDDCSTDNTVEICEEWLKENKDRFVRTKLLTVKKNTGIPANCNKGLKAAKGEWIKYIAGDDILLSNCIKDCISFINNNYEISLLFGNVIDFNKYFEKATKIENRLYFKEGIIAEEQYQYLLRGNQGIAPSAIIKKSLIIEVGGFDETFKLIEDYQLWIKIAKKGYKAFSLKNAVVKHRISEHGISSKKNVINCKLIPFIRMLDINVRIKYCLHDLPLIEKVDLLYVNYINRFLIKLGNRKTKIMFLLEKLLKLFNPFFIYKNILKLLLLKHKYIKYRN